MPSARALPILMYHHVSPQPGLVTVSPQTFRDQIAGLARRGYRSAGCDELAAFLAGTPLPEKSVMITFDDGYLDNFVHAHPVLREFGFTAVLFLITGRIGDGLPRPAGATPDHRTCMASVKAGRADEVMLRWSEVEAMRAAGSFEFHSHTHTHARWDREIADPAERDARLAADLEQSRTTLIARLGAASAHLCWPQGYHDAAYRRTARAAGFRYLYTVEKGTCVPTTDPQHIPRVVTKERTGNWLPSRLWLYRRPLLAAAYAAIS
ncbi:MAG: polysaccharide deacetylase family protein [Rhodocyclaceae bacterium]|nr:polysaccharide deacetylase family protein [Rhodocyclaceae bacterium]